jgi:RNA polymerase primary sigma factor
MLYGLDGNEPFSIKEVGDFLELSRERIRQIREKSFKLLRKLISNK